MPSKARDTKHKPRTGRPPNPYPCRRIHRMVPAEAIPEIDEYLEQLRQDAKEQAKAS